MQQMKPSAPRDQPCWSWAHNENQMPQHGARERERELPCWQPQAGGAPPSRAQPFHAEMPAYSQADLLNGQLAREQHHTYVDAEEEMLFDGEGSRFDDAARIRQNQSRGSTIFDDFSRPAMVPPRHGGQVSSVRFG